MRPEGPDPSARCGVGVPFGFVQLYLVLIAQRRRQPGHASDSVIATLSFMPTLQRSSAHSPLTVSCRGLVL